MSYAKSSIRKLGDRIGDKYPNLDNGDINAIEGFRTFYKGEIIKTYTELFNIIIMMGLNGTSHDEGAIDE